MILCRSRIPETNTSTSDFLSLVDAAYLKLATIVHISSRTLMGATDAELDAIPTPPPHGRRPVGSLQGAARHGRSRLRPLRRAPRHPPRRPAVTDLGRAPRHRHPERRQRAAGAALRRRELSGVGGSLCHGPVVSSLVAGLDRVGLGLAEPRAPRRLWGHQGGAHGAPDAPRCSCGVRCRLHGSR